MNYIYLFYQLPIIYAVETTLHCLIAAIVVEWVLIYWNITNPKWRQSFLSLVIILPPLTFFLYLLIDPEHYLYNYTNKYIFQSYYWIYLRIGNFYPIALFILLIFFITIFFFIFQEIIPMITHYLKSKNENISEVSQNYLHTKNILNDLLIRNNYRLTIIDDEDYIVYSKTNKMNNIYISKGVIETLNHEELKGIILHEIAHLERNKKNYIFILYILRIISFFNPIILYEFRRLLQEEEMVCDFLSAEKLQNKKTLARALFKLYIKERINQVKEANFKEYTAYYAIRKRIKALWANRIENSNYYALLITATILIIIINYFIV